MTAVSRARLWSFAELDRWQQRSLLESVDGGRWLTYVLRITLAPRAVQVGHVLPTGNRQPPEALFLTMLDVIGIVGDAHAPPDPLIEISALPAAATPHVITTALTERGRRVLYQLRETTDG